jgi:DNA-binding transcriptional LysR family regulator
VASAEPLLSGSELAAFAAAVETGTVRGAAEALNLTQSAATKRIAALERRTGAPLLVRSSLGVAPTELGRLLYPEAKHALAALAAAEQVIADHGGRQAAPLRLAASQTLGEFLVPGWLAEFRLVDGRGRVELDVANSPAVLTALRAGDVDLGFVEGSDALDGLDTLVLLRDEIVVVVDRDHPWSRRGRPVDALELVRGPYLTRELGSGTRAIAETALALAGVTLVPVLEAASTQSLKRAVRDGGFTLLSRLAVEPTETQSLSALSVQGADLWRDLRAVRVRDRTGSSVAQRFWSFLRERSTRE